MYMLNPKAFFVNEKMLPHGAFPRLLSLANGIAYRFSNVENVWIKHASVNLF